MLHSLLWSRVLRGGIVVFLTVTSTLPAYAGDQDRDKEKEDNSRARLPAYGPGAVVPVCYNSQSGDWRLVSPWGVANAPALSCRPPAPWDSINVPAGGWSKVACTTGGAFDCREHEFFLELNSRGPQGPLGLTGPQGSIGPQGPNGAVGPIGPQGSAGPPGVQGPVGPTGAAGVQGNVGPVGATGAVGPTGPVGPTGAGFTFRGEWDGNAQYVQNDVVTENGAAFIARSDNGAVDPAELSGGEWALLAAKGAVGLTGPQGYAGPPGVQGPVGPMGAAGVQGNVGPAGATGAVGPTGPVGPTGAGATVTDISPSGPCGPVAGVSIADGAGHIGIVCDGATGATGATGPTGPAGTAGESSATFLETSAFTASPVAAPTVPPLFYVTGLYQTISVPSGAAVHIESTGGVQTQSATVPGFSVLDVLLFVDGVSQPGGWTRLTAANVTLADKASARWHFAQSVTLAAGTHTIGVAVGQAGAAGGGSIAGSVAATVGGVNPSPLQGTLTVTILKQ